MADQTRAPRPSPPDRRERSDDQRDADVDQTAADSDQTASDADQAASDRDDADASQDQRSADRDQASADADHAERPGKDHDDYEATKAERSASRVDRVTTHISRRASTAVRDANSAARDRTGSSRDTTASHRAERIGVFQHPGSRQERALLAELEGLRERAAAEREQAAKDRERAASERVAAAAERERLQRALDSAHVDDLTGALRREMGWQALALEIERARRSDGSFVLVFIDVDGLKVVNDRSGHGAGDFVLTTLVATIRSSLRPFDPIVRYGGDEFVCGMGGVDVHEARRRFESIGSSMHADTGVGISVGMAVLAEGDDLDQVIRRADADLLEGRSARVN